MLSESVVKKTFFLYRYRYEKYSPFSNSTLSLSPCLLESDSQLPLSVIEKPQSKRNDGKMIYFFFTWLRKLKKKKDFMCALGWTKTSVIFFLLKALPFKSWYYSAIKIPRI